MKVVIIGAGNVATVLGRLILNSGHTILQVVSRQKEHAATLAGELGCDHADNNGLINRDADIYLVAISDTALYETNEHFNLGDKLIVHTSGAVPKDVLQHISSDYGVLYPLQSLRREITSLQTVIPFMIDGNSESAISRITEFAGTLSRSVMRANDAERLKLHVAAVLVNNFTNHLYVLASGYCKREGLDFSVLQPLIEETALRLRQHDPATLQTGPAARKDIVTMDKHLRLLADYPSIKTIYLKMTDSIINQ